jgi:pyridoxamine 5'-phosphate oxidase
MDPVAEFVAWHAEARQHAGIIDADAVALATATRDGRPSVRMVLYRGMSSGAPRFFTNYDSRKARELADNPRAALCFHWPPLERQVRFEGVVERLPPAESDDYFRARPLGSQLSATVSPQSRAIADRESLVAAREKLAASAGAGPLARPEFWGGFRLIPETIELWRAGAHRLHERRLFTREGDGWRLELLAP